MPVTDSETKEQHANLLDSSLQQINRAMERLELPTSARTFLRSPQHETRFQIPVKMGDGSVQIFPAFRIIWNSARGPSKGGLRFHPELSLDLVRTLASSMAWKTAVLDLPLGGGKGGVVCNPKQMSERELEALSRSYIRTIAHQVGPKSDVPAPDVYTDSKMMAWMMDEYETITQNNLSGVVTGKPVELGGSRGRDGATALGGIFCVAEASRALDIPLEGKRAAIQGYGKAGAAAHRFAVDRLGLKVVAVSDSSGGIYNEQGLDYEDVHNSKQKTGSVSNYPTAETISNEELLELDVTVLFPSALENVITEANADRIQADIVAELANNPTTPAADEILFQNGVYVIPDILCNAGGVTVSYFEQVQNASTYYWSEEKIHKELKKRFTEAFRTVHDNAVDRGIHNRLSALMIAVERIHRAMSLRGWV